MCVNEDNYNNDNNNIYMLYFNISSFGFTENVNIGLIISDSQYGFSSNNKNPIKLGFVNPS